MEKIQQLSLISRPKNISEFIGNESIKSSINYWVKNGFPKCMFLIGQSGTGKTTLSNIIKDEILKGEKIIEKGLNYMEIDCSLSNKSDVITLLEDSVKPTLFSNKKVIFLDEVQELRKDSQNLLLKLMEDLNSPVYFVLSTMDDKKISTAVLNRCQILRLNPLSIDESKQLIKQLIKYIDVKKVPIEYLKKEVDNILIKSKGIPRLLTQNFQSVIDKETFIETPETEEGSPIFVQIYSIIRKLLNKDSKVFDDLVNFDWMANFDIFYYLVQKEVNKIVLSQPNKAIKLLQIFRNFKTVYKNQGYFSKGDILEFINFTLVL